MRLAIEWLFQKMMMYRRRPLLLCLGQYIVSLTTVITKNIMMNIVYLKFSEHKKKITSITNLVSRAILKNSLQKFTFLLKQKDPLEMTLLHNCFLKKFILMFLSKGTPDFV